MAETPRYPSSDGTTRLTTCSTSGPMFVHVKDDKIVRIEPMQFEPGEVKSWKVVQNGKEYKPPLIQPLLQWGLASKQSVYSENREKYPLKRVDWDPNGERNTENRGVSGYERISWDEAYAIIETEMRRILDTYGPSAFAYSYSAHPEWGSLHFLFSDLFRFWHMIGATHREFTPNSWEGWACGAPFLWGDWQGHGLPPATDSLQDTTRESELIILWGTDPIMHNTYNGIDTGRLWKYWNDLGKRVIVIDPLYNETGMFTADSWIRIIPGTDNAMGCAIAYIWITEGLYDQEYLDTHAVGFDEDHLPEGAPAGKSFKTYILGEAEDGIPKTPEWASKICGVPVRVIKQIAYEWASKPTSMWVLTGGACRRTFAHEFARLFGTLQVMQGFGKPGVNMLSPGLFIAGPYDGEKQIGPTGYADGGMNVVLDNYYPNKVKQSITFQKFYDCVYNPPQKWHGGHQDNFNPEMYLETCEYPMPGHSECHFYWQRGGTLTNQPGKMLRDHVAYKSPKVETFVVADVYFNRDCRYADLVLPITTLFERQDITEPGSVGQYVPTAVINLRSAVYSKKCIEPIGESKTDLEIFEELARRLGYGDQFMEGNTEETILEKMYTRTNIPMEYDDFKEKGYYVWPAIEDYVENKQWKDFYEDPENHPLDTPTGKVEIFSTLIWDYYGPDNPEIPVVPHYIEEKEGRYDPLAEKYPFQDLQAHPKFRFHGKFDDCEWLTENYKVYGPDGYPYEPAYINPDDAARLGIEHGDIIRAFNDRGGVLAGAQLTHRVMPGVVWLTYGAWNDPLEPTPCKLDRSGDINAITNPDPMSVHHVGGAYNSTLVGIEKADLEALAREYPEGFAGKYRTSNWKG